MLRAILSTRASMGVARWLQSHQTSPGVCAWPTAVAALTWLPPQTLGALHMCHIDVSCRYAIHMCHTYVSYVCNLNHGFP